MREAKGKGRTSSSTSKANSDITCFNCDRKGHYKTDCWRPGGGKEGQGPNQQWKKADKGQKQTANAAAESSDPPKHFAFVTSDLASVVKDLNVPVEKRGAIMDSGATSHFCPDRSKFSNFVTIPPQKIHTADGSTLDAIGRGDVDINLPLGNERTNVTLKNALYAPKMAFTLISTTRITSAGLAVLFEGRMCQILSKGPDRCVIAEIPQVEGLYSVVGRRQGHHAHLAKAKLTVNELHRILGHVSQTAVLDAVKKGLVMGVELDTTSKPEFCDVCIKAKSVRKPFPAEATSRALTYGELVHTDLWGPAQTMSIAGALYYISFTDDFSRQTKLHFLKLKSEALTAFKAYEAWLARQSPGVRLCKVRSNRGGEYLRQQGIERQLTVHDSPQQNGVAERLNKMLVEHARAMLLAKDLPKFLWAKAVNYATWLKNRLPSRATPGTTPFELVRKAKLNLVQAHEFGATVYVHVLGAGKLEARAEEAIFVGVDAESKGY